MIKNITFHSLFLIALVSLVYLGSWQLHRLEWKTELLNSIKDGQTEGYIEYPYDIKNAQNLDARAVASMCMTRVARPGD